MDAEKIEGLLMDHALGATSGDVAALVEAYVEKDAAARGKLEEWGALAAGAKRAMRTEAVMLPEFPRKALEQAERRRWWGKSLLIGAGMAACVAMGFGSARLGEQRGVPEPMVAEAVVGGSTLSPQRVAAVQDFWSVARLRAYALNSPKPTEQTSSWMGRFQSSTRFGG
jgi:hypothetical protein